uniref:Oxidoreductase-like domain-containing protein n=1 Tax=Lutzomyia longipalpis TaxID=7200 RepID=A0A1B0CY19_LUTLO
MRAPKSQPAPRGLCDQYSTSSGLRKGVVTIDDSLSGSPEMLKISNQVPKAESHQLPALPDEPTNCCMSGCANCVWIEYARELTRIYRDGGEKARKLITNRITDPNIRTFLEMELKNLDNIEDKEQN